jgi:hypothetical protein
MIPRDRKVANGQLHSDGIPNIKSSQYRLCAGSLTAISALQRFLGRNIDTRISSSVLDSSLGYGFRLKRKSRPRDGDIRMARSAEKSPAHPIAPD